MLRPAAAFHFDIPQSIKRLAERFDPGIEYSVRPQHADALEANSRFHASRRRASNTGEDSEGDADRLAHRITLAARTRSDCVTSISSSRAIARAITSSNFAIPDAFL
jgi:hypothetical protein